jgi:hypothetical protein
MRGRVHASPNYITTAVVLVPIPIAGGVRVAVSIPIRVVPIPIRIIISVVVIVVTESESAAPEIAIMESTTKFAESTTTKPTAAETTIMECHATTADRRSAVCSIAENAEISPVEAAELLGAIENRHKPISGAFCSDAGVCLMRIDSELILRALRASNDDGFGALPIHDALIAPARNIGQAQPNMVEAFETIVGRVNPCQVRIKEIKVPHMGEGVGSPRSPSSAPHLSIIPTPRGAGKWSAVLVARVLERLA